MRLVELVVKKSDAIVRRVEFKNGLNLILDKPTSAATHSGNNVGKTTVLRLIDLCFGSEGADIWTDPEFKKNINQDVYDFLHGSNPAEVSLILDDAVRGKHILTRAFAGDDDNKGIFRVDETNYKGITAYRAGVKELLFGVEGEKPTLRQLMPKFVRSSHHLLSRTLKFLYATTTDVEYEIVHLFLFGFFQADVLEERPRLQSLKNKLDRDWQTLDQIRSEGEIDQLLLHLRREIAEIERSRALSGEVPEIAERAGTVTAIRAKAAELAAVLGRYDGEIAAINMAIGALESEYSNIDRRAVEAIYKDAQKFIPELHHEWNDLSDFVQNLRLRKQRFLQSQLPDLNTRASGLRAELTELQAREQAELGSVVNSPKFAEALMLREDLAEKLKKLGSLEQDLKDREDLKKKLGETEEKLEATRKTIEQEKASLTQRVGVFNKYFSRLSKALYGEEYLLYFTDTDRGSITFQLKAVGANVGGGKKASQTAAFDLAYIEFLREAHINFPSFVCHDGIEQIHHNQLSALFHEANKIDGQLIIATLRDKLPEMLEDFLDDNTILELAQDDKLLHI